MIWGAITYHGLVPSDGPLFYCDLKEEFLADGGKLGPKGGYTGELTFLYFKTILIELFLFFKGDFYAWVVKNKVVEAVLEVIPEHVEPLWEDDCATIHRTAAAKEATSIFEKIDPKILAPKMADIWPIEQVRIISYCLVNICTTHLFL